MTAVRATDQTVSVLARSILSVSEVRILRVVAWRTGPEGVSICWHPVGAWELLCGNPLALTWNDFRLAVGTMRQME